MQLTVNGRSRRMPDGCTVAQLMETADAAGRGSAVAVDGVVIPRGQWTARLLAGGESVEIVHAVQGG
jgi:sulfur carrier protein